MTDTPRLIEVAFPLKQASLDSVHEKNVRHGHIIHGQRGIEVKGRAGIGDVDLTANEWPKACNQRGRYWLYVVYDCGTSHPRLLRVQDPFGKLVGKAKRASGSTRRPYSMQRTGTEP
ncbi:MAG: protein NO VEIN domain-containing protein [Isosphaerales bacterium]